MIAFPPLFWTILNSSLFSWSVGLFNNAVFVYLTFIVKVILPSFSRHLTPTHHLKVILSASFCYNCSVMSLSQEEESYLKFHGNLHVLRYCLVKTLLSFICFSVYHICFAPPSAKYFRNCLEFIQSLHFQKHVCGTSILENILCILTNIPGVPLVGHSRCSSCC